LQKKEKFSHHQSSRPSRYIGIDLGPAGGNAGGIILCEGTPEEIIENENSITGEFLKREMGN